MKSHFVFTSHHDRITTMLDHRKSGEAFAKAMTILPGGVNSPVRAFKSVGGNPVFFTSGNGAWLDDIDGNRYCDFVGSWGPMILGHAHPAVTDAVIAAVKRGTSFGAPSQGETELAGLIQSFFPSIEMVRLVNSGTEATMSAVRLARGFTGRSKILKFEGCYHGHGDSFLIAAGSGALTLGIPDSPGITKGIAQDTLTAPFNDTASVNTLFDMFGSDIAACIVEPVVGNMGVVPPNPGFLDYLRTITRKYDALLIFDEVMTGFRVSSGGAQKLYNIQPDLTTLGKVIGGGMPIAAYCGSKEIMQHVAPAGKVYQAGTLSGNPVAVASGIATLKTIQSIPSFYDSLDSISAKLAQGMLASCKKHGIPALVNRVGSMLTLFFTDKPVVQNLTDAKTSDVAMFGRYFHEALDEGIYLPPSQFEAMFVSGVHSDTMIETVIDKLDKALVRAKG